MQQTRFFETKVVDISQVNKSGIEQRNSDGK